MAACFLFGRGCPSNNIDDNLSVQNDIMQKSNASCTTSSSSSVQDNTVIVDNSNIGSDFTITAVSGLNMQCQIDNNLKSNISSIISSSLNQKISTSDGIFPSIVSGSQSQKVHEQITNNISQILSSTCKATSNSYFTGNTVIFKNSTISGGVTLGAVSQANANCVLGNMAALTLYNNEQTQQSQENTSTSFLTTLVMIIGGIILLVIVLVVLLVVASAYKSNGYAEKTHSSQPTVPVSNPGQQPANVARSTPSSASSAGNIARPAAVARTTTVARAAPVTRTATVARVAAVRA